MFLFQSRTFFLVTLLASIGALGAAFVAQYAFDMKPCILCLWQRIPYALVILDCLAALILVRRMPKIAAPFIAGILLLFLASAALAAYHFGVEEKWWVMPGGCPVGELGADSAEIALQRLLATPMAACDEVAWRVLGISITFWNVAVSLALALYATLALARSLKHGA